MSSKFSQRDIDEIKPHLDRTIQKFLGFNEPALVTTAANCLLSGYDKGTASKTLATLLDEKKAAKLADKIYELAQSVKSSSKPSRKRQQKDDQATEEMAKKQKIIDSNPAAPPLQMVSHLSPQQVVSLTLLDP